MSHGYLVVVTTSQCYVYTTRNWNTPTIFDLKDGSVALIVQADKHFLLVESNAIYLYSYEGRLICSPRWPGMRPETLSIHSVSLSNDCVAVKDQVDEKNVHLFDTQSGKPLNDGKPFSHRQEVAEVALDQVGLPNSRKMAIVDKNRDLFLVSVRRFGQGGSSQQQQQVRQRLYEIKSIRNVHVPVHNCTLTSIFHHSQVGKLGSMVQSMCWNSGCNLLATVQDSRLTTYLLPSVVFVDRGLLPRTVLDTLSGDFGKSPTIASFVGNAVSLRRADGSLITAAISPYPALLLEYALSSRWGEATR